MSNTVSREDLPEVMEVRHVKEFLGIGHVQAYDLVNSGKFHIVRVGRLIKIPKKGFLEWFEGRKQE